MNSSYNDELRNKCSNPTARIKLSGTVCIVGAAANAGVTSQYPIIAAAQTPPIKLAKIQGALD